LPIVRSWLLVTGLVSGNISLQVNIEWRRMTVAVVGAL